ncbi:hypothetical protein CsSME_00012390 [Camellia sinensis var. sinensis]
MQMDGPATILVAARWSGKRWSPATRRLEQDRGRDVRARNLAQDRRRDFRSSSLGQLGKGVGSKIIGPGKTHRLGMRGLDLGHFNNVFLGNAVLGQRGFDARPGQLRPTGVGHFGVRLFGIGRTSHRMGRQGPHGRVGFNPHRGLIGHDCGATKGAQGRGNDRRRSVMGEASTITEGQTEDPSGRNAEASHDWNAGSLPSLAVEDEGACWEEQVQNTRGQKIRQRGSRSSTEPNPFSTATLIGVAPMLAQPLLSLLPTA